jgi:GT2 family glycosyltransferase
MKKIIKNKVSIIITTYNNQEIISECLNSIDEQTYKDFECILIDDNSADDTLKIIKNKFRWVRIITNNINVGPSINRNKGINQSEGEFILTIDSDVILEKEWIRKQVDFLKKDDKCGIVGSKLIYYGTKDKINSIGGGMTLTGIGFDIINTRSIKKELISNNNSENKIEVLYVCSAAMMIKRKILDEIGLFDEDFFYGHEDTDLCWRTNIRGYKVYSNLDASAIHHTSFTMKKRPAILYYYANKNRVTSLIKNYELHNVIIYLPVLLLLIFIDVIFRSFRIEKLKSIIWNLKNIKNTLNKRKIVQKSRKVSDREIKHLISKKLF